MSRIKEFQSDYSTLRQIQENLHTIERSDGKKSFSKKELKAARHEISQVLPEFPRHASAEEVSRFTQMLNTKLFPDGFLVLTAKDYYRPSLDDSAPLSIKQIDAMVEWSFTSGIHMAAQRQGKDKDYSFFVTDYDSSAEGASCFVQKVETSTLILPDGTVIELPPVISYSTACPDLSSIPEDPVPTCPPQTEPQRYDF